MDNVELLQNGCTIVGDGHITLGIGNHFVHTTGTEGGAHSLGDGLTGVDVTDHLCFALLILGAILQQDNRGILAKELGIILCNKS